MSSSEINLENYRIPLEEIHEATEIFSSETQIGDGGFGFVHVGQLSDAGQKRTVAIKRRKPDSYQGKAEFHNELAMVSKFHHPNIITFIGYCDDGNEMIIVFDYAVNGSLDYHIQNPNRRRSLTWTQRLKICLGAARGLQYLHSGLGEHDQVIHRDVKSANILLDGNMEAKICDFGLSKFGKNNQEITYHITNAAGTKYYTDPVYAERSRLKKESDVYSFGVVMFELSSGALVYQKKCFGEAAEPQYLIDVVRSYYDDHENSQGPDKLIDPFIRSHIDMTSFHVFNNLAHDCLNLKNVSERPTMDQIIQKLEEALNIQLIYDELTIIKGSLENFLIPLTQIKLATADFSHEKCIGDALFGAIYKGQHSGLWQNRTMAIVRLYPTKYKDKTIFYEELQMISSFHHQNICRFIGYSDEGNERIIVHEYAANGSLRDHLEGTKTNSLTWAQRMKIWMGVARGLQSLQLKLGVDNKAILGNINCDNVMLDKNMEAKICFFGLSKQGRSKREPRVSDMYAVCIILFEMMVRLKMDYYSDERTTIKYFREQDRRDDLRGYIDPVVSNQIGSHCLNMFETIAYQMAETWENPETRISMDVLVQKIEVATHL